ncbi:MAG: TetR/AcrR family transcriptional regulator [bacterium]
MKHGERKKQILLISLELFANSGYSETSIREIARRADIRESAIYNHFESKSAIIRELTAKYKTSSIGLSIFTDELLDEIVYPQKFIKNFTFKLLNIWKNKEECEFFKIIVTEQAKSAGEIPITLHHFLDESKRIWIFIFNEMLNNELIKNINPQILAETFISHIYMVRVEYLLDPDPKNVLIAVAKINDFLDFFWSIIKKEN